MKALTFQGKQTLRYESIPDPEILQPTDAIVSVTLCAIVDQICMPITNMKKDWIMEQLWDMNLLAKW